MIMCLLRNAAVAMETSIVQDNDIELGTVQDNDEECGIVLGNEQGLGAGNDWSSDEACEHEQDG